MPWPRPLQMVLLMALAAQPLLSAAQNADAAAAGESAATPSLEDLLRQGLPGVARDVEVSTGSRFAQGATRAPTLTYVVTQEMIQTYGLRSMSDILRLLPGLYVSENTVFSSIGARGLGRPGDFNGRVLVLLDGMRVNQNIHDAALIGPEFPVDADMIERVEFTPGPGSALYGNNAFFGVINVFSKRADRLAGGEVRASVGAHRYGDVRASSALRLDSGVELGASLSGFERPELQLPDYVPARYAQIYRQRDWDRGHKLDAYGTWQGFSLRAGFSERQRGTPYRIAPAVPLTLEQGRQVLRSSHLSARLEQSLGADWDLSLLLSSQRHLYRLDDPYVDDSGQLRQFRSANIGRWSNAEARLGRTWGGVHYLSFGVDYQHDSEQRSSYRTVGEEELAAFWGTDRRLGVFVQDQWRVASDHTVQLGLRHDHTVESGSSLNPRLAWVWTVDDSTTARLVYGSAFRGANLFEFQVNALSEPAAATPTPERIRTLELAWDQSLSPRLRYRASAFRSRIGDLISYEDGSEQYINSAPVHSQGMDLGLQWQGLDGTQIDLSWSWQRTRDALGRALSNSPTQLLKLLWSRPLWSEQWRLGVQALGMSRRLTAGAPLPGHLVLNARLLWQIDRHTELGLGVYNAADIRFQDKPDPGAGAAEPRESRNFLLQVTRRFGS